MEIGGMDNVDVAIGKVVGGPTVTEAQKKEDAVRKVVNERNDKMEAHLGPTNPLMEEFNKQYDAIEAKARAAETGRDDKGRFLPKDGKPAEAEAEETPDADAKGESVGGESDAVDGESEDTAADVAEVPAKAEPAKADTDSLDATTVAKAARLGLDDAEIESYSNAELKAVVKALEKRKAAEPVVDKSATKSEEVVTKVSKEPETPALEYDKLIEEGHDDRLINHLKAQDAKIKFLTEQASRKPEPQMDTVKQMSAEEVSRDHAAIDEYFDSMSDKYGTGPVDKLRASEETKPFAKARVAAFDAAMDVAEGLRARGKQVPPMRELLEMGHVLSNRKTIHKDAARMVSKTIQDAKKNKIIARPTGANAPTKKPAGTFQEAWQGALEKHGHTRD